MIIFHLFFTLFFFFPFVFFTATIYQYTPVLPGSFLRIFSRDVALCSSNSKDSVFVIIAYMLTHQHLFYCSQICVN